MNELIKRLEELENDVRRSGYFETEACEIADIRASIGELAAIVRELAAVVFAKQQGLVYATGSRPAPAISFGTQQPPDY